MNFNKYLFIKIFFVVIFSLIISNSVFAITEDKEEHSELFNAPEVIDGSILSVKDCVALAFKNSPKVKRKKYELDIAKSDVGIAKSRFFPIISAGVGFNYEMNSDSIYYDKRYRDLPYLGVAINQLIYDFGKSNANIKMEKFYKIGAEYEFVDELCHTLFEIKGKYYELLKKSAILSVVEKDIEINKEINKIAKDSPDKYTAEINLIDAKRRLIEAQKDFQNAKYNLSNSMYIDNHKDYLIQQTPTFNYNIETNNSKSFIPINFPFKKEDAVEIAYKNSPDLQVLVNIQKAMEEALKYTKRVNLPNLNASVGYGFNRTFETKNNNLQIGVGLSTDINIKELKHNIDKSKAELYIADNEIELFKKDLYYEVQRALNNVERTEQQLLFAKKEVEQAIKNFNLINSYYIKNKLDYIALQDARKDYIKAEENYISCLYDYNMSIIQTEMALHYHIVDIHHKTEHAIHSHADELIEHLNESLNCDESENKRKGK